MSKKSKHAGWPELFPAAFTGFANPGEGASPFSESIAGGMDFMKAMMGTMPSAVPGFVIPTVDLDELDKRIKDLRAVESWLALNANMLKQTIQGLDVQRNTIAALKAYGGAGTAMAKTLAAKVAAQRPSADDREHPPAAPFVGSHLPAGWPMPAAMRAAEELDDEDSPPDSEPREVKEKHKTAPQFMPDLKATAAANPALAAGAASANAWMSFLQDQFARVANAAVAGSPGLKTAPPKAAAKPAAKKRPSRKKAARKKAVARRVLSPRG
jgi:hypothetical protein